MDAAPTRAKARSSDASATTAGRVLTVARRRARGSATGTESAPPATAPAATTASAPLDTAVPDAPTATGACTATPTGRALLTQLAIPSASAGPDSVASRAQTP